MKLKEIEGAESQEEYVIFCDLDGVLVDFEEGVRQFIGYTEEDFPSRNAFWREVRKFRSENGYFFDKMPPMPDYLVLWNKIKDKNTYILTALGKDFTEESHEQKLEWAIKNLGITEDRFISVDRTAEKANYAKDESRVLIDDRQKAIDPWREAGSVGILHKNAQDSLAKLKKIIGEI